MQVDSVIIRTRIVKIAKNFDEMRLIVDASVGLERNAS